jgi:putative membrane protein
MARVAAFFVGLTAAFQLVISTVEMFFWSYPKIYERLDLGLNQTQARTVEPIVQNAGLYNAFLAAGLIWGLFGGRMAFPIRVFFLSCVIIAGIFGAVTLKPTTLVIQSLPAALALVFSYLSRPVNSGSSFDSRPGAA